MQDLSAPLCAGHYLSNEVPKTFLRMLRKYHILFKVSIILSFPSTVSHWSSKTAFFTTLKYSLLRKRLRDMQCKLQAQSLFPITEIIICYPQGGFWCGNEVRESGTSCEGGLQDLCHTLLHFLHAGHTVSDVYNWLSFNIAEMLQLHLLQSFIFTSFIS